MRLSGSAGPVRFAADVIDLKTHPAAHRVTLTKPPPRRQTPRVARVNAANDRSLSAASDFVFCEAHYQPERATCRALLLPDVLELSTERGRVCVFCPGRWRALLHRLCFAGLGRLQPAASSARHSASSGRGTGNDGRSTRARSAAFSKRGSRMRRWLLLTGAAGFSRLRHRLETCTGISDPGRRSAAPVFTDGLHQRGRPVAYSRTWWRIGQAARDDGERRAARVGYNEGRAAKRSGAAWTRRREEAGCRERPIQQLEVVERGEQVNQRRQT